MAAKLEENQEIIVINEHGKQESGFKIFIPKPDRDGLISVVKDGCVVRVNPKRIVTGDSMPVAPSTQKAQAPTVTEDQTTEDQTQETQETTEMDQIVDEIPNEIVEESETQAPDETTEGEVTPKATKAKAKAPKPAKPPKVKPIIVKADLDQMATQGELWNRSGVDFDGKTKCSTICILFPAQHRYLSFNTYNGTFGKKGKLPPIQAVLDGEPLGYPIKDLSKLREKLTREGYKLHEVITQQATPQIIPAVAEVE